MDLSTFYGWFGVNSASLIDANKDNNMGDSAMTAWANLSQWTLLFFVGVVLISFLSAVCFDFWLDIYLGILA